jgi:hypothetical protein
MPTYILGNCCPDFAPKIFGGDSLGIEKTPRGKEICNRILRLK